MIAVLAVCPITGAAARVVGRLDKVLHLCEYALFAWCLVQAMVGSPAAADTSSAAGNVPPRSRSPALTLMTAFMISTAYGALLEGVQAFLPYRSAELGDVIANAVGAGLGVLIARPPEPMEP